MYLKEKFEEENDNEKKRKRCNYCGCKRERESRRVKKNCLLFDVQKAELKKYIIERTGYREKQKIASFTAGYNEMRRKIAEEDFFRNVNVRAKKAEIFTENNPSFLCAQKGENGKKIASMLNEKHVAERGITLLALIITVVIMIILAAVTINVTLRDGGLVDQAKWAAEQTANSTQSEQEQLENVASQINDIIAGIGSESATNSTGGEDTNSVETNSVDTNSVEETNTIDPEPDPIPDGTITIGDPQWQPDGTANVSVTSSEGSYIVQYQINGTAEESWQTVKGGIVTGVKHGDTVYARITDGEQYSNPQNKKIEDLAAPEKANIEVTPANVLIGESLTAKVTHVDNQTGVDIENSKWVINQSSSEIGTEDISAYTGKFTTNGETITLDSSTAGTYYLHILTTDMAGNKTETVSEAITISGITGTVTQNGDVTWSAGQASISLTTTESQHTIVYKINGEGSWQTYNGTSITGLSHGDIVTACLTNGSQTTFGPEAEFTIQDTTNPTVTVTAQGSPSTNSITVTAQAVDNESGMIANPTYTFRYKTSGAGSYTTPSDASDISSATYTFTGLTQGTSYDIQVIVNGDVAGNSGTGTTQATTTTVPGADEGLETGNITASPVEWDNYKASTTLTTNTSFKIQYQINGVNEGSWSEATNSPVTVSNLDHGNTVYARLTDGVNAGDYAAINILDGTPPTVSVEVGEVTDSTIKVTVTASDGQSGLASSNAYKYYLNSELSPRATSSNNTYTYTGLTGGTDYNIKVEVVDKGNNIGTGTATATTTKPAISETNSFVGNYADVDGDGTADGVIYADLAIGGSGSWGGYRYTIPTGSNFKKYTLIGTHNENGFGTKDVIQLSNISGSARFYIMALEDIRTSSYNTFYWYYGANSAINDYASVTSTGFGRGKQNTTNMMTKWNGSQYGSQNARDIWGVIQNQVNNGWYIPSRDEWAAFAGEFDVTSTNYYSTYRLSSNYWLSSLSNENNAYVVFIPSTYIDIDGTMTTHSVRLGTTF